MYKLETKGVLHGLFFVKNYPPSPIITESVFTEMCRDSHMKTNRTHRIHPGKAGPDTLNAHRLNVLNFRSSHYATN